MKKQTNVFESWQLLNLATHCAWLALLVACTTILIPVVAYGADENGAPQAEKQSPPSAADHNPALEDSSPSVSAPKPSNTDSNSAKPDVQGLAGRNAADVEAALGKPTGKMQTAQGALWLYSEWRVQFDKQGRVLKVEKDQPTRLAALDPQFVVQSEALAKAAAERAAADDRARAEALRPKVEKIRVVSNGGQRVDLPALLAEGKVTVVDFYADWCGPCRELSPKLEQLVKEDSEAVLLKIDIVRWGTPVAEQFDIKSIPDVRVFRPNKEQVGEPTHDLQVVMREVKTAKLEALPAEEPVPEALLRQPRVPAPQLQ